MGPLNGAVFSSPASLFSLTLLDGWWSWNVLPTLCLSGRDSVL